MHKPEVVWCSDEVTKSHPIHLNPVLDVNSPLHLAIATSQSLVELTVAERGPGKFLKVLSLAEGESVFSRD